MHHCVVWIFQEIRELQELQRTLYTFLHVMATHNLSSIFLAPNSRGYLDAIMQLLLLTSCSHKDAVVRKVIIVHYLLFVNCWSAGKFNYCIQYTSWILIAAWWICVHFQMCVQIFVNLVKDWCTKNNNGEDKVFPPFQETVPANRSKC